MGDDAAPYGVAPALIATERGYDVAVTLDWGPNRVRARCSAVPDQRLGSVPRCELGVAHLQSVRCSRPAEASRNATYHFHPAGSGCTASSRGWACPSPAGSSCFDDLFGLLEPGRRSARG